MFLRSCDAVAFAHARGIVHRDLKPDNVMLGEFGDVVVLDWGVAKVLPRTAAETQQCTQEDESDHDADEGVVVGTPGFMAPEQVVGAASAVDARTDVFGLGALLQFLLTDADSASTARPLTAIVARATLPNPEARCSSVSELAAVVRRWLDAEPVSAYRAPTPTRAHNTSGRSSFLDRWMGSSSGSSHNVTA